MINALEKIISDKKSNIEKYKNSFSVEDLKKRISSYKNYLNFKDKLKKNEVSVIAEIKKASPSAGVIVNRRKLF
jgi:indole-3-glycerol phosphate synthase